MNELQKLEKEYQSKENDAKHAIEGMKYLRSKGQENSDLYKNLFKHLNNLSNERDRLYMQIERLSK